MTEVTISLYQGMKHTCSYLPEETACMHVVDPQFNINASHYGRLLESGFRRSGDMVYRPGCEACTACLPARIPVNYFHISRSQRRCINRNNDLEIRSIAPELTQVHFDLYKKYLEARHADGEMKTHTLNDMQRFLLSNWSETLFIEGWLKDQLVFVAVTDVVDNALSALYTYFDPEQQQRSLGTFGILQQVEACKSLNLNWLYLGYWIADCKKMAYKEKFRPLEIYTGQLGWHEHTIE